ncbi:MAG TPA: SPOR domain-containing protein [Rhodothermales bacterium]|nr:SPOR domain-containing protein [Rhodothermales bacterium]
MRSAALILACSLLLAACASSRTTSPTRTETPEKEAEEERAQVINHAAYEDFDPAPYEEAAADSAIHHDVPEALMQGRADAGLAQTVRGYRIQLTQTQDKDAADAAVNEAMVWWREQAGLPGAPAFFKQQDAPVYILYRQPYYRVRVGNFASRDEAQEAAAYILLRFPGAAVVPDTVTLPE